MQCPVCDGVDLAMTTREGIEIDYCPKCRGVWLDRGELDKIIERSAPVQETVNPQPQEPRYREDKYRGEKYREDKYRDQPRAHHGYSDNDHYRRKKKKSLLGELFDF
ncbi:zf-TFIIB domain-containing protein [Kangiella sp.]|uniref:TFIIB-type zinc ribbon-containing protein n=1 Tax=Kangiella sp. TaxID=1920245 RepID=UPI0019B96A9C|nr:zf-TFIIB domain-containing protein [Kangiella sp.]MBD3653397.1 zf-TFIIB domain-containing protein [Kangiella sp.]